jgi:AraC family transcriptional regulator of adaptative response/methylated-DNA-[protein]-cysteine methyltransferase
METTLATRTELEDAVLRGDRSYEGLFVVGVSTTRIFCRPGCPARKPRRENMTFFANADEALRAGFRPCLRCRPLEPSESEPDWARGLRRMLDADPERRVKTSDLRALGLDPDTVRRHFRRRHGMTFQAYARARRLSGALSDLRRGKSIDHAVGTSGFESHSGFRSAFARLFGGPPGARRDAPCAVVTVLDSPLGALAAAATSRGACLLEFADRRMLESQLRILSRRLGMALVPGSDPHLDALARQLEEYFAGRRTRFDVPLDLPGTPFQREVWSALQRVPYGETRSYAALAAEIGRPGAARAVGRANGQNRLAIVVPCHRVVNEDGSLGGYGGGLRRKRHLLDLEREVLAGAAAAVGPSTGDGRHFA